MPAPSKDWTERLGSISFVLLTSVGWVLLGFVLAKDNHALLIAMVAIMGICAALWIMSFEPVIAWRRGHWHYERRRYREEPPMTSPGLGITYIPGPNSPNRSLEVRDITANRRSYFIHSGYRPTSIQLIKPVSDVITDSRLPHVAWIGRGRFVIERFTPHGVIISEDTSGDDFAMAIHE